MAAIKELLRAEENGTLSFGDYELDKKAKLSDFPFQGDLYKVKTYSEITKLEKNELFVYESVPGTAVTDLRKTGDEMSFTVEGPLDAQITVEMEADTEYEIFIDGDAAGVMRTNLGGKLSFNAALSGVDSISVRIVRV
ncbi:MAG: endosialidase [Blautia sp.]|nr:endosialidase [Blautia sp.]